MIDEALARLVVLTASSAVVLQMISSLFFRVVAKEVMHLPSDSSRVATDEVGGGKLAELAVDCRFSLMGEGCGCASGDVGTSVERQHAEEVLLLWKEAIEGLVKDGTQVAFTVVDAVQPTPARSETFSTFDERLTRVLHKKCGDDLQGQRQAPAAHRHPLSCFPVLFNALVVRIRFT